MPVTMRLAIYTCTIVLSSVLPSTASHVRSLGTPTKAYAEGRATQPIVANHHNFPLRILPLGASITYGQGSDDGNGYRNYIRGLLEQRDTVVDMVGNVNAGLMRDNV